MLNTKRLLIRISSLMALTSAIPTGAFALNEADIVPTLMEIHGSNWATISKSDEDRVQIRKFLKRVIDHPAPEAGTLFEGIGEDSYALIRDRAISEFGKFVQEPDGKISSDALKYFQAEAVRPASGRVQLMESLKNAKTPETTAILLALAQNPEANLEDRTYAIRLIEDVFSERPKVHRERWDEVAQRAEKVLGDISRNEKLPPYTVASARESLQRVQYFMKKDSAKKDDGAQHVFFNPSAPQNPSGGGAVLAQAEVGRQPASTSDSPRYLNFFLFGMATSISVAVGIYFQNKKDGGRHG